MRAEVIQVIRTSSTVGLGKTEDDPVRVVTEFWSLNGELLVSDDPWLADHAHDACVREASELATCLRKANAELERLRCSPPETP